MDWSAAGSLIPHLSYAFINDDERVRQALLPL
jgi:hypothetical protein